MVVRSAAPDWSLLAPELDNDYRTTFRRLSRIFRSRGFSIEEADDLAQDAIARVLSHLDRHGRRGDDLQPLLNTIAKNLIVERFRTGGRELPVEIDERLPSAAPDPSDVVVHLDRDRRVHAAIRELPVAQRRALVMWIDGLRPAEIAGILRIKRNAVDALLHRARRQLAVRLEACRDSLWSAGIGGSLRLRSVARRLAGWPQAPEAIGSYAPALAGLAVTAVLSLSVPSTPATSAGVRAVRMPHPEALLTRAAPIDAAGDLDVARAARLRTAAAKHRPLPPKGVRYDLTKKQASVIVAEQRDPRTGAKRPLGIEVYTEPGEGDPGITDPLIDSAIQTVCSTQPELCEGG
jgi:RNA polymerase sigma factor (sigma-70 family)